MSPADIAEYAVRYCMTRTSYAFTDGLDIANQYWGDLSAATKCDVIGAAEFHLVDDWVRWQNLRSDVEKMRASGGGYYANRFTTRDIDAPHTGGAE